MYLDGSSIEIFINRYINTIPVGFAMYSDILPNNGNLNNEAVKIFGVKGVFADIKAYQITSCWGVQPD